MEIFAGGVKTRECEFHQIGLPINSKDTFSLENAEDYIDLHCARRKFLSSSQLDQSDFKDPGLEKGSYYL